MANATLPPAIWCPLKRCYVMQKLHERKTYGVSTPEQLAAARLTSLGFALVNRTLLPYSFTDKDGTTFNAMADFYHAGLELWVEVKCNHLNGKTSKANAERAYSRIEPDKLRKHPTYYQIQHQWNHAAPKQAIVQTAVGARQFVIAFTKQPDEETLARITKQGIQAYSLARFRKHDRTTVSLRPVKQMPDAI